MSRKKTKHRICCADFSLSAVEVAITDRRLFHYCLDVLRLRCHDRVTLFDGHGKEALAEIVSVAEREGHIVCKVLEVKSLPPEKGRVTMTVCQSILKGRKMDFALQKCTEIGVDFFFPMFSQRSVTQEKDGVHGGKLARWHTIIQEASRQSGRSFIPTLMMPATFTEIAQSSDQYDLALIPCLKVGARPLKSVVRGWKGKNILILVGPEGGFEDWEIDRARQNGCIPVSLGSMILRSETAAMAIMAMLRYELE
ncbi:MAG: 16S rRNA (uracil(1498)-N(3))-methyltransferase [Candidatus Omnitrophica bacterium]|nr:16S rRNA (uracil(1498)-N(3))-methyltransferase [Candidatus Omnitrophota bacterium]